MAASWVRMARDSQIKQRLIIFFTPDRIEVTGCGRAQGVECGSAQTAF